MQINTDLSPVYSPKSNVSSSFTSPKDPLLPALNFNQIRQQNLGNHPSDSQLPKQSFPKNEKSPANAGFPVVNNQNQTTTTNESFSIEKNTYLEMSNRDSQESSNSEILILQGNSIETENINDEEEITKNQNQQIHILEYEEFVLNENNHTIAKDYFAEKAIRNELPKSQKIDNTAQNIRPPANSELTQEVGDRKKKEGFILEEKKANEVDNQTNISTESKQVFVKENKFDRENEKKQEEENIQLKKQLEDLMNRVQELTKENAQIKQERESQSYSQRERINTGRESERILREKEEIKNKFLQDENKVLRDNQNKFLAVIHEKDEQILQLKHENEEISKNSKNELYIPLVDKVRLLKEKVAQSSKQIEEQVEVIESKNTAIENLLSKMEKLTDSLSQKNNQVNELKEEIEKLKSSAPTNTRDSIDMKVQPKNVGSLYAKIRDKEKYWFSPEKPERRPETSDLHHRKSYSPTNSQGSSERKGSRPNSSHIKSKESSQKGVIKLTTINQDKSLDDQYNKSNHWSTLKWNMLNQRDKLEKETTTEKNQNLYKKMKNRSIDHYTQPKNESKNDSKSSSKNESRSSETKKNTQNIEDLQKRLAYLKYKRMEFEKKKHDEVSSKEDRKATSDILATTTSFADSSKYPASKHLDSLISPSRNLVVGRYRESSFNKDEDLRKNESLGSSQIHSYKAAQKAVPVYKSIELNPEADINYTMKNLKTSLTSKHGLGHAKIDNYTSTPTQGLQGHHAEDDFKNPGRYHSYSNVSKFFNKMSENSTKSYKRSYDLSSHSKIGEVRSITEASTKNKGTDFFK